MIWALPLLPALAGLVLWATGPGPRTGAVAAAFTVAAAALLALLAGPGTFAWSETLVLQAALPPAARVIAVTVAAIALPVLIFAAATETGRGHARLLGLLLVFVGGMELVVMAADFVTLLIGWEIVGACSWALIGHRWREGRPVASANYAFVMTRLGDLGLFVALFTVFAATGETGYDALGRIEGPPLALVAAGVLVAAISKAGQLPFAPWLFRAMDGPTPVSALLHSATMVAAGVYLLARLQPDLAGAPGFAPAAMTVGLFTAVLGGIEALRQMHAKKLLAASTSAQMGLMIATVGAGYPGVALLHLVVHAAFKAALFVSAGVAHRAVQSFDLRQMSLGRTLPWAAAAVAVAALSLAAVPPLAGGWSKEEMVKALEHAGLAATLAAITAGGLGAAYAMRFAWMAFGPGAARDIRPAFGSTLALALLSAGTLVLSLLWLPAGHDAAAAALGAELPEGSKLGLIASLSAVALGALTGLMLARAPGDAPPADWFGLPRLIAAGAVRPVAALARAAAHLDDRMLDGQRRAARHGPPGAVAAVIAGATAVSRGVARIDDRSIDGQRAAAGLARAGAVEAVVRGTRALAALGSGRGESLSDLIATGPARLAGQSGTDARRLQTGMAHHYYAILIAGTLAGIAVLIIGG